MWKYSISDENREEYLRTLESSISDKFDVHERRGVEHFMIDKIPGGTKFYISYPLGKVAVFSICEDQCPFEFVKSVVEAYDYIYKVENETSDVKEHLLGVTSVDKKNVKNIQK